MEWKFCNMEVFGSMEVELIRKRKKISKESEKEKNNILFFNFGF